MIAKSLIIVLLLALFTGRSLAQQAVAAEPVLRLLQHSVSGRAIPTTFVVEDYHGKLRGGYGVIRFVAPGGEVRWDAWTNREYIAVARAAMMLVEERAVGNHECNRYFSEHMPGAKTFAEIWRATGRERIRISFSPGPSGTWRAATYRDSAPFEWTITETAVRQGPESVASAMVHEATRTNGIGPEIRIALGAEKACGMKSFLLTEALIQQLGWRIIVN